MPPRPALRPVKDDIIKWWGPIIHEYYGATEGLGFTACNSQEWLAHRGTVGRVLLGDLHILDENMKPCPVGTRGHGVVQDRDAVRIFQRSRQDPGGPLGRRQP